MEPHEVMVCMRCAGLRRSEMTDMRPMDVRGVNFGPFALSNVVYKGPLVRDVLIKAGFDLEKIKGFHLISSGLDDDFRGEPVETSVPLSVVLDPINEVILAYSANGESLPEDHGFPIRILYPGYIGLRSTKWLIKMIVSE